MTSDSKFHTEKINQGRREFEHLSEQMTKRLEEKPGGEVDERREVPVGVCERLVRPIGGRGTAGTSVDNCQPIVGRGVESSEVGI